MTFIGWSHGENWAAYSHERLYTMVRTEADIAAVAATEAEMGTFRALMEESVDDVERALAEAGVSWQGLAAESMNAGVSPLAQWARDAAAAADASGTSARDVGAAFRATSYGMPEPVATPSKTVTFPPAVEDLLAAQQDQDAAEREAQNAKRHAVELMETYSTNSAAAQNSVGTFVPPQGVTVGPPEPKPDVISVEDDAIEEPADGGDPGQAGDSSGAGYRGGPVSGDGLPVSGGDLAGRETTPGAAPPPGGTDPARVTSPPNRFPPVAGPVTAPVTGGAPVTAFGPVPVGDVGGRGADRVAGGGRGPGGAPGSGGGGTGRGPAGGGIPGRGGAVGTGPLAGEPVAAARGGAGAAARPGTGMGGFGPMGAARRDDEDKERTSPEYLRDFRDDIWDDTPPVAPPVIGDGEDD